MSYRDVGRYYGDKPFEELVGLLSGFTFQPSPNSFTTVSEGVKEVYQPLLDHIFLGEWRLSFLVRISPWGIIARHRDNKTHFEDYTKRFHLVLETNPNSWCLHGGIWQQLHQGEIYTLDPNEDHGAVNWDNEPRTHLVVDCDGIEC